jgi:GNAT superfamily N-acetyltransferase
MSPDFKVEKLGRDHVLEGFDCGKEPLNRFLIRNALQNQQANASQTYVLITTGRVIGYHTLVVGEVAFAAAPERLTKGLARHSVPIMLLARLAVSRAYQGRGIGRALLKDALLRTLQAANIAGIRAFAVHAKDDGARAFYGHFDFIESPTDPMHLFLLLKDVRVLID